MLAAVDCDLRRIYCMGQDNTIFANAMPTITELVYRLTACSAITGVLFEIASAVDYTDSKSIAHNKRRWTIFNVAAAVELAHKIAPVPVLVAPSSEWTKGYSCKVRHTLAKATAVNKDLRECQAMLASLAWGAKWIPLAQYTQSI